MRNIPSVRSYDCLNREPEGVTKLGIFAKKRPGVVKSKTGEQKAQTRKLTAES